MNSLGRRFTLSTRLDELIQQYVYEYTDTVIISKKYGVSSSAVQEILSRHGYTRIKRKEIYTNLVLSLNQELKTDNFKIIYDAFSKKVKNVSLKTLRNIIIESKVSIVNFDETIYKISNDMLNNILDELRTGISPYALSQRMTDISYMAIRKIGEDYKLYNATPLNVLIHEQYTDEQLITLYNKYKNCKSLSSEIGYPIDTVRGALKKAGVSFGIPEQYKALLLDKNWCENAYRDIYFHNRICSELLDNICGPDTASYYIHQFHGIPIITLCERYPELQSGKF